MSRFLRGVVEGAIIGALLCLCLLIALLALAGSYRLLVEVLGA